MGGPGGALQNKTLLSQLRTAPPCIRRVARGGGGEGVLPGWGRQKEQTARHTRDGGESNDWSQIQRSEAGDRWRGIWRGGGGVWCEGGEDKMRLANGKWKGGRAGQLRGEGSPAKQDMADAGFGQPDQGRRQFRIQNVTKRRNALIFSSESIFCRSCWVKRI